MTPDRVGWLRRPLPFSTCAARQPGSRFDLLCFALPHTHDNQPQIVDVLVTCCCCVLMSGNPEEAHGGGNEGYYERFPPTEVRIHVVQACSQGARAIRNAGLVSPSKHEKRR